ncbi:polysaccharide deacetylase family protein [Oribacterium sp. WCC10]|uniref:polysaccharide deacetylase family protein n=1 Tax=Oribacterium sp. WCC10 TaxID=1855343 RepID=UPI0008E14B48|nr:polysaccharide deacetylase family protein [Oribacterium sp. WCC10]SFG20897.1 hypothetical protein SAMN05216356_103153 [Oribacterium sp. WCC10]
MSLKNFSKNNPDYLKENEYLKKYRRSNSDITSRSSDTKDGEHKSFSVDITPGDSRKKGTSRRRVQEPLPDENSEDFYLDDETSESDISFFHDEEKSIEEKLAEGKEAVRNRYRQRAKKRQVYRLSVILIAIDLLIIIFLAFGIFTGKINLGGLFKGKSETNTTVSAEVNESSEASETAGDGTETAMAAVNDLTTLIATSDRQAAMYDYDAAIATLSGSSYASDATVQSKIQEYQASAAACVPFDNSQITHIFFHILCVDTDRAFTNDAAGKDFNQVMTTIPEFEAILQQMYDRGYVLVGLHDMAEIQTQEDGTEKMVQKKIMLPEGKKAFVMSEDDVCYYEYMEGKGFADKMVLDENGKLKLQYTDAQGNVSVGDYDIVPILDNFIEQHPDFSYRGAKAIMAFTGYNGVLGYRTDETYDAASPNYDSKMKANDNIAADRETVRTLFQALVDDGYELASHSWGHVNFTKRELADLTRDTDRWERNVESLMPGNCDIILYPFGADIADWHPYTTENEKFNMLENAGFRYFCNVDSSQVWVQFGSNFVRQGRRNLDGYRLWMDYSGQATKLSDLLDVSTVFDTRRPTPITWN